MCVLEKIVSVQDSVDSRSDCKEADLNLHIPPKDRCVLLCSPKFNSFPDKPCCCFFFVCLQYMSFENTVGKEEIARNEQFLLFPQCFLPICKMFCYLD